MSTVDATVETTELLADTSVWIALLEVIVVFPLFPFREKVDVTFFIKIKVEIKL